ncbi:hypothetical protein B0O80DRAFT_8156 [Mortierella sp. GBAus27b]|nr:hypothetical protein B0O80DRAFT_8156 [Mortierella sp. GBAus27b]
MTTIPRCPTAVSLCATQRYTHAKYLSRCTHTPTFSPYHRSTKNRTRLLGVKYHCGHFETIPLESEGRQWRPWSMDSALFHPRAMNAVAYAPLGVPSSALVTARLLANDHASFPLNTRSLIIPPECAPTATISLGQCFKSFISCRISLQQPSPFFSSPLVTSLPSSPSSRLSILSLCRLASSLSLLPLLHPPLYHHSLTANDNPSRSRIPHLVRKVECDSPLNCIYTRHCPTPVSSSTRNQPVALQEELYNLCEPIWSS